MNKVRRYDLDWLRVLVFGLLIFYHVGMFFVPWGWHLKNNELSEWMTYPMLFVNQWRLNILFIISGMGTCFALAHRTSAIYIKERLVRLAVPLLFGMLLIVPPQVYLERVAYEGYVGSYMYFLMNDAFSGVYPTGNISWHHLWFLPYLLIFSILLTPVFIYLREHDNSWILCFTRHLLEMKFGIFWLTIPLILAESLLEPFFNVTHALIGDWFALTNYAILFFYGYLLIKVKDEFWKAIDRIKGQLFVGGILFFSAYMAIRSMEDSTLVHFAESCIKVFNFWIWILVLFAYGAKYLNKKSKLLSYCNTAVYPFYILHQTVTVIIAYFLMNWEAAVGLKFLLLSVGIFFMTWVLYEFIIRRVAFIRPLFGLKRTASNSKLDNGKSFASINV